MDWVFFAKNDWDVYQDKQRVSKYVEYKKITEQDYLNIVGEPYGE